MTKSLNFIIILICIPLLFAGCIIRTLYPIYDKENILHSEILNGVWKKKTDKKEWTERWHFIYDEDGQYNLNLITKFESDNKIEIDTSYFEVVLCEINNKKYLDLTPNSKQIFRGDFTNKFDCAFLIPAHTFLKIEFSGERLYLYVPNFDAIENILYKGLYNLNYKKLGKNDFIITAETDELKKFISNPEIHRQIFNNEPLILLKE